MRTSQCWMISGGAIVKNEKTHMFVFCFEKIMSKEKYRLTKSLAVGGPRVGQTQQINGNYVFEEVANTANQ